MLPQAPFLLAAAAAATAAAAKPTLSRPNCPPLGPVFEKPTTALTTSPAILAAIANLTTTLTQRDQQVAIPDTTTYSIEVFSTSPHTPLLFTWHHTAASLSLSPSLSTTTATNTNTNITTNITTNTNTNTNANTNTKTSTCSPPPSPSQRSSNNDNARAHNKAGPNAVYRLGGLSKVLAVYTWLAQDGDAKWDEPVTRYVPELAAAAAAAAAERRGGRGGGKGGRDPVVDVDWEGVTLGALAGQLAGVVRDYGLMGELTQEMGQDVAVVLGFPPLDKGDPMRPKCGQWRQCNRTEFFNGMLRAYPSFAPFTTPAYTNTGFQILAYALEAIKGKSFEEMMQESILRPLGLKHTYYRNAPASEGIIPGSRSESGWDHQLGDADPAGNMYTSPADLSTLGRSILASTLLPATLTRRWLKPGALSSSLLASVGRPWAIRRIPLPLYAHGTRVVDAFTQAGRIGAYASLLVLLPDYGVGFSVLGAGADMAGDREGFEWGLADLVGARLVPALEAAAREQADGKFAGEYVDEGNVLSRLRLTTQGDRPGLGVEDWVSNGTDMMTVAVVMQAGYAPVVPSVRLYPAGLETVREDGSRKVAFKAVFEDLNLPAREAGMFSGDCGTWASFAGVTYGTQPLDQFVFEVDREGDVRSIESVALRSVMSRRR